MRYQMKFKEIDEEFILYGLLFAISNRIQTIGDGQFDGMTMKQHFMLVALGIMKDKAPTLKETSEVMGCSYQNVKRMAVQLEQKGYLHIVQDKEDRRKQRLILTDKSVALEESTNDATENFMKTLYQDITKEEMKGVIQTLIKMSSNLMTM